MTVIPFPTRASQDAASPSLVVSGRFDAPGGRGRFTGIYRVERCTPGPSGMTVVGVFAGALTDADGARVGLGARRHRGTARGDATDRWRLDGAVVDLLGFTVTMEPVQLPAAGRADGALSPVPATGARR